MICLGACYLPRRGLLPATSIALDARARARAAVEVVVACEIPCQHTREVHRGGFGRCQHRSGCPCPRYKATVVGYDGERIKELLARG